MQPLLHAEWDTLTADIYCRNRNVRAILPLSIATAADMCEPVDFDLGAILTAYCTGGDCDSATGTTQTDPLQALYVCVPQGAVPKKKRGAAADEPYSGPVKLELLCACSGKPFDGEDNVCLNPDGDHIGRCSTPCVNSKVG